MKVAQNWRFQDKPEGVYARGTAKAVLPGACVRDLGHQLKSKGYQARHFGCQLRLDSYNFASVCS